MPGARDYSGPVKRRQFLGGLSRLGAFTAVDAIVAGCSRPPGSPSAAGPVPPSAPTVRDFGARGDGLTDDTAALNAAVRAASPGGAIVVPDGTYLVNPVQSVVLRSNLTLSLAAGAVLKAIPVSDAVSAVVVVKDAAAVTITGGTILGERASHPGTTGEWGMGIDIRGGTDVTVDGVTIRDCWGDGIYVGVGAAGESRRVTIRGCRCLGNRRQGLSMTGCLSALVENSEFSGTGGTQPQSGIDLEPNIPYAVRDVVIRDCVAARNAGWGIVLSGAAVTGVTIERNRCTENASFGGIALLQASDCTVRSNTVEWNSKVGIQLDQASRNVVTGNTIRHNSQIQPYLWPNVQLYARSVDNTIAENVFADAPDTTASGPRYDVLVYRDCDNNRIVRNILRPRQLDPQRQPIGGVQNDSPTTLVADNT